MERYTEAKKELDDVIRDFPDRTALNDVVHELQQLRAKQRLREIEVRSKAGQFKTALGGLQGFPPDGVEGATLQKVRVKLEEMTGIQQKGLETLKQLNELVEKLPDSAVRSAREPP